VAGDAALLADPRSPEELAAAIARCLDDADLRRRLIEAGRARARAASWDAMAAGVCEFVARTAGAARAVEPAR
jgi:glycosyltransferase involved in cell wall biosynthesis